MKPNKKIFLAFCLLYASLSGCGFHLRGKVLVPPELQVLHILPQAPFNPFQQCLRAIFATNGIQIVDALPCNTPFAILNILSEQIVDRTIAFGIDGQNNRIMIQFTLTYQITTSADQELICPTTIQVERELNINPNAVLGTDQERAKVVNDLYIDATQQIMRHLTPQPLPPPEGTPSPALPQGEGVL